MEGGRVDVQEAGVFPEEPFGCGGEVGVSCPHPDDQVRFPREPVGRQAAGHADPSQIERMAPGKRGFARLGLAEGDVEPFGEDPELIVRAGIPHPAPAEEQGPARESHQCRCLEQRIRFRRTALERDDPFLEEGFRIIPGLPFRILGHRDADRAGVGRVGQHPEGIEQGAHQLLRPLDPVEVPADGPEGVVGGDLRGKWMFDLLEHRVRLTAGIGVSGKHKQGDAVRSRRGTGSDHIGRAGSDGGGGCKDLPAVHLSGIRDRGMGHALFILPLIDFQPPALLRKSLPESDGVAMPRKKEQALDKWDFGAAIGEVLVLQKTNQGLGRCEPDRVHRSSSAWKMC